MTVNLPFGIDAMVVNTVRRGPRQMAGMGDNALTNIVDNLTGGTLTQTEQQLQQLETFLKISIAASCISGALALAALFSGKR